ncbi:MAG TPA: hypothetical protein VHO91_09395 [Rhodopila sp.]|nr:hypothetical protein [Rhodopila sp.]
MKKVLIVCLLPLGLAGCLSYSSSPPPKTTVVVPQGSAVTCSNGQPGPC